MHFECGFLRIQNETEIALISAHNFGICSIEEGTLNDKKISLKSTNITRVSFAKEPAVTALKRDISLLDENTLEIITEMSTTTTSELTKHLQVIYKKKTY